MDSPFGSWNDGTEVYKHYGGHCISIVYAFINEYGWDIAINYMFSAVEVDSPY